MVVKPNRPKKHAKVLQKMHMCKFFIEKNAFLDKKVQKSAISAYGFAAVDR